MKVLYPDFGKRVKEAMRSGGITFEELTNELEVSESFTSKLTHGSPPSFGNFIKIVNALGVSSDSLLIDYLKAEPKNLINLDPALRFIAEKYITLKDSQKELVLHLINYLAEDNK